MFPCKPIKISNPHTQRFKDVKGGDAQHNNFLSNVTTWDIWGLSDPRNKYAIHYIMA